MSDQFTQDSPQPEQPQGDGHVVAQVSGTPANEPATGAPDVTGLTLQAHRDEDAGFYYFGVTLSNAFVPLMAVKLGLVDDKVRQANEQG